MKKDNKHWGALQHFIMFIAIIIYLVFLNPTLVAIAIISYKLSVNTILLLAKIYKSLIKKILINLSTLKSNYAIEYISENSTFIISTLLLIDLISLIIF